MGKRIFAALLAFIAIGLFASLRQAHAEGRVYTVQQGDSLSSISQQKLGDVNRWVDIYNLNKDDISDPNVIYPGEVLQLPDNTPQQAPLYSSPQAQSIVTQDVTESQVPHYNPAPVNPPSPIIVTSSTNYRSVVDSVAAQYGVSAQVMDNVISCESGFNPNAYNLSSGATGIAQYLPSTWYSSSNPFRGESIYDPIAQITYMGYMMARGEAHAWECYTKLYG